jgi:hypothetical protein
VAGTPALYERERDWEKVRIPGPIKEDILIYVSTYISIFLNICPSLKTINYCINVRWNLIVLSLFCCTVPCHGLIIA